MKKKIPNLEDSLNFQIDYTANFNKSFKREFYLQFVDPSISADECSILFIINANPMISQSEIARLLFKGKAHVGKILNEMETKGLLTRIADTRDNIIIKRNKISEKGLRFLDKAYNEALRLRKRMEIEFPNGEREQFLEYLKRYRRVLNEVVDVKLK